MPDTKLTIYYKPLRDDVSRKYGKRLTTATDFINLSQAIQNSKAGYVSPSTLKRFWGYVSDSYSGRRQTTLDVLAVISAMIPTATIARRSKKGRKRFRATTLRCRSMSALCRPAAVSA